MLSLFSGREAAEHVAPPGYPERQERLDSVLEHLEASGHETRRVGEDPRARTAAAGIHDGEYLERFARAVERGDTLLDSADNPICPGSGKAVWSAASAAVAAADWVAESEGNKAFAVVRPPGHHAERARAMGFCFVNNVAVAAEHLLQEHGIERVAIFDFDVHHGNGTQHIFESRSDVFFASTHQFPFYPGTGSAGEVGKGAGEGFTLNVPLPAGAGDAEMEAAITNRVLPAILRFEPEVLLLSAGYDAWRNDPIGGMAVSEAGFVRWAELLAEFAESVTGGRMAAVLEGGYDVGALPRLVESQLAVWGS